MAVERFGVAETPCNDLCPNAASRVLSQVEFVGKPSPPCQLPCVIPTAPSCIRPIQPNSLCPVYRALQDSVTLSLPFLRNRSSQLGSCVTLAAMSILTPTAPLLYLMVLPLCKANEHLSRDCGISISSPRRATFHRHLQVSQSLPISRLLHLLRPSVLSAQLRPPSSSLSPTLLSSRLLCARSSKPSKKVSW
jgi:hypothetical protein